MYQIWSQAAWCLSVIAAQSNGSQAVRGSRSSYAIARVRGQVDSTTFGPNKQ